LRFFVFRFRIGVIENQTNEIDEDKRRLVTVLNLYLLNIINIKELKGSPEI